MSTPGKCGPTTPTHHPAPGPQAVRCLTGGAGRSTQCGCCGGPDDFAPKQRQPTNAQDQPSWHKRRFVQCGVSRPMKEHERVGRVASRSVIVNIHQNPVCAPGETLKGDQLQIEPCGPFGLDLTAWALRRHARKRGRPVGHSQV
jgi:hypothetical protein